MASIDLVAQEDHFIGAGIKEIVITIEIIVKKVSMIGIGIIF